MSLARLSLFLTLLILHVSCQLSGLQGFPPAATGNFGLECGGGIGQPLTYGALGSAPVGARSQVAGFEGGVFTESLNSQQAQQLQGQQQEPGRQQHLVNQDLAGICGPTRNLQSTAVGAECWAKIWAAFCKPENTQRYEAWHHAQSLEILISDVQQWATLPDAKHRTACYGEQAAQQLGVQQNSLGDVQVSSHVRAVSSHHELMQLLQQTSLEKPLIFAFGSETCGFCVMMDPVFELIAEKYSIRYSSNGNSQIIFVRVDVQQLPEAADLFQIQGLPAFRSVFKGQLLGQADGADTPGLGNLVEAACTVSQIQATVHDETSVHKVSLSAGHEMQRAKEIRSSSMSDEQLVEELKNLRKEVRLRATRQEQHRQLSPQDQFFDIKTALYTTSEARNTAAEALAHQPEIAPLLIIGGGPAGLAAASYAARAGLCPILIAPHTGGQLLAKGADVENYPGLERSSGSAIVADMRLQAQAFATKLIYGKVTDIDLSKRPFQVKIEASMFNASNWSGAALDPSINIPATGELAEATGNRNTPSLASLLQAHSIIYATGAESRWLHVPGEEHLRGHGISSCAVCDGFVFRGKTCAVIGGGDTALEEALFLSRICASPILIIHRRGQFRAGKALQKKVFAKGESKIHVLWHGRVQEFLGETVQGKLKLSAMKVENTSDLTGTNMQIIPVDAAFVAIGHDPNTELLKSQVRMQTSESRYIETMEKSTRTSVDGFFAAGDVADPVYRQAITSAGSGAAAALDAERFLTSEGITCEH